MITRTLAVCLFLGCLLFSCLPAGQSDEKQEIPKDVDIRLHRECLYPTIQLFATGRSVGTGFLVRSEKIRNNVYYNLFLTCDHVIGDEAMEAAVFDYEDWSYVRKKTHFPCTFYGFDSEVDIAIGYFLSDKQLFVAKLDMECKTYIGSDIFKIGCGKGYEPRLDFGKITTPVRKDLVGEKNIRHSAMTTFGDSGGALFYQYKVIGIVNRIQHTNNSYIWQFAFALPISRLHQWSKNNCGSYDHVYDKNIQMPRMPQYRLEFVNKYEIKD